METKKTAAFAAAFAKSKLISGVGHLFSLRSFCRLVSWLIFSLQLFSGLSSPISCLPIFSWQLSSELFSRPSSPLSLAPFSWLVCAALI
jgi:hypothetical protein